jgi:Flp pilus assembly pilin Flp
MSITHPHRSTAPARRRAGRAGERGASLVEYALLVALIAVVCIGAVTFLGTSSSDKLQEGAGDTSTTSPACAQAHQHPGGTWHSNATDEQISC